MVALPSDRWLGSWPWALVSILALSGTARARPSGDESWRCGQSTRPYVELGFEDGWDPKLQQSIRADLAAGLRTRGLLVCSPGQRGSEPPLASVQLSAASDTRVAVEIQVHDALTNKYVMREVDTRPLPNDARGLALATAAEELLRASWAELAIEDARPPAREPPVEVVQAVRPIAVARRNDHVLGVRAAGEHHSGGQTMIGPEAWFDVWFSEHFAAELSIGYRRGLNESSKHGSIQSEAAVFGADALISLAGRSSRLLLMTRIGFSLAAVEFVGRADANNESRDRRGVNFTARAALVLRLALGDNAELRLDAGPGINLHGLSAVDDGVDVTGTKGALGQAGLGFGAVF
ncbi:MAG TPA: hypothetical protein VFG30_10260 [Polyangiales bacterium]|jgi:hypothetical protein|nr:hypothetical protein [Polyangiales bacterium]